MKILHYFLGFPPYRSGGLTKYAADLMRAQAADKHTVMALWPGRMGKVSHRICIKRKNRVENIESYELVNSLPVALDEGIIDFNAYTQPCDESIYKNFFREVEPDVIHLHTLMGLHREFVEAAQKLHIKTVFTTHDYFGICPKVTLYRYGAACENDHGCQDCIQCNCTALSLKKIQIMQSPLYRSLKNSALVKKLRKRHRENFFTNEAIPAMPDVDISVTAKKYRNLREYYISMLKMMHTIHFNSSVTEFVYRKYFTPKRTSMFTITHRNISDNRKTNKWSPSETLKITSLAPAKPFKGFNVLRAALDQLWNSGKRDFELYMFSPVQDSAPYMKVKEDGFTYGQLGSILSETDVLISPGIWYETFGFTVLEAISYGVPVIISDHVGAQDIADIGGLIVKAGDIEELKRAILSLTIQKQKELRDNIQRESKIKQWREFLNENYSLYKS